MNRKTAFPIHFSRKILQYSAFIVFAILISLSTFSQAQTNNWFFSGHNGLNFSTGNPVNLPGGQISASEGASVISDKNGQLLFYTDGIHVWNKNHVVMPNGNGLGGGSGSSTQSSLIVPKGRDEKQYYIFTADEEGRSNGFQYAVVDMTLNGGLGAVTIKNQQLVTPCSEKVTAVRHCNKKDYWVITHKYGSDAYYAYLATENGVDHNPVISQTGSFIPVAYATMAGVLKSSPDGKRIVAVHPNIGVDISDFNNQTGVISNTHEIFNYVNAHHYGAEFSASSRMLYVFIHGYWYDPDVMRHSGVFQFDLSLPTITDIMNSKFEVFRYHQPNDVSSLQRALNGKIYMTNYRRNYLSVINSPEIYGMGCNFVDVGFSLTSNNEFSLPNFLNDYGTEPDSFQVTTQGLCADKPINFNYNMTGDVTALLWDFADPSSGLQNNSTATSPSHIYTRGGNYTVKLIKYSPCGNDTLTKPVSVGDIQVSLGSDTTICAGSQYLLSPQSAGATSFSWQDGSNAPTYTVSSEGLFWVQASNNNSGCIKRDSMIITTKPLPVVDLGKDTSICAGTKILLDALNPTGKYTWQDNSSNATFLVSNDGKYWVEVELNGCKAKDSINIMGLTKPQFTFGPDQYLCPGLTLILSPGLSNVSYLWQDGSAASNYKVQQPGLFYVDIINLCGTSRDSINIYPGNCTVYVPSGFTPNKDGLNDLFRASGTGSITDFEMKVYGRWGQLIYSTNDKLKGWDGTLQNLPQPTGVYVWTLRYKTINDPKEQFMKGTVMLIR